MHTNYFTNVNELNVSAAQCAQKDVDYSNTVKLLIIGTSNVRKSSILHYYEYGEKCQNIASTIGIEFISMTVNTPTMKYNVQIWDTAGQEKFRALSKTVYHATHGIVAVFDITNDQSFKDIDYWLNDAHNTCDIDVPILIIGNKTDLEHCRVINKSDGELLAQKVNGSYTETSAYDGSNVDIAITSIISAGINKHKIWSEDRRRAILMSKNNDNVVFFKKCCSI